PTDVETETDSKGRIIKAWHKEYGEPVIHSGMSKMSKSKNNGIDPHTVIEKYGADTVRLFMMFTSPPEQTLEWSDSGVEGASRFIKRVWKITNEHADSTEALDVSAMNATQKGLYRELHKTIAKVTDDVGRRNTFNTAIAAIMELLNHTMKFKVESTQDKALVNNIMINVTIMLSPIAPHMTHELWKVMGQEGHIEDTVWPVADKAAMVEDEKLIVIQVNGKVRAKITIPATLGDDEVKTLAREDENVIKFTDGKTIRKEIYIKGKLVNIVAN
ncbi:MAG: class I tRNA ligase family protein, partial [Psychrosphaera sp.]|nr:class I tRNA ligase family protein [Psychrosphaera sp.]